MEALTPQQCHLIREMLGWLPRANVRRQFLHHLLSADPDEGVSDELDEACEAANAAGTELVLRRKLVLEDGGGLSVWGTWTYTLRLGRRKLCTWTVKVIGEGQQFGTGLWLHEGDAEPEPLISPFILDELGIEATGGAFPEDIDAGWAMLERHQRRSAGE